MYRLDRDQFLKFPLILLWALLGFQAGFINGFGFLACGRYVSHVTGFGSQIGIALANINWSLVLELIGFPLAFIAGAFFSSLLTAVRLEQNQKPRYDLVSYFFPAILLLVTIVGMLNGFGPFGATSFNTYQDFILLYSLAFTCGAQNGCFATLTKGQIRTTHLTGISTDLGTDLAKLLFVKLGAEERALVKRANYSRLATFAAFSIGSIFAVYTTEKIHYLALLLPFSTAVTVCLLLSRLNIAIQKPIKSATTLAAQKATAESLKDSAVA